MDSTYVPGWLDGHHSRLAEVRGHEGRLHRLFSRSRVPMLLVDDERRYLDVNVPARLAFRRSLAELRQLTIDDLTPAYLHPVMTAQWEKLMTSGTASGPYEVASPDDSRFEVTYYGLAQALPGVHLIAFAPKTLPDAELRDECELARQAAAPLTRRETEVLELAANGQRVPAIAKQLQLSPSTVRTHFEHIYAKLGASDRAAAVAAAIRLGLIR